MDFITEMNEALELSLDEFKALIKKKLRDNKDYLQQFFWTAKGEQLSVLNYLIAEHQPSRNLIAHIGFVLDETIQELVGDPLHQALAAGKTDVATYLLEHSAEGTFEAWHRDSSGRSLLALVLDTLNLPLLSLVLTGGPCVNHTTVMPELGISVQPVHQAVVLDYAAAVTLLAENGAQLANPVGAMHETPLLLAARFCTINALHALLDLPVQKLAIEATNNKNEENSVKSYTAIEELCRHIENNNKVNEAIRGVAMLLCNGAEPPRDAAMRAILGKNRVILLKAVHGYLEHKPELVDAFVNRCHLKESELHNIVYADHSWGSSIRHLFGKPSDAAFIVEGLVNRKYGSQGEEVLAAPELIPEAAQAEDANEDIKLYAEFVKRYTQAYASQRITNPWSAMRWMIAEGRADWQIVLRYAKNFPSSRTNIIISDMFGVKETVHDDIEVLSPSP